MTPNNKSKDLMKNEIHRSKASGIHFPYGKYLYIIPLVILVYGLGFLTAKMLPIDDKLVPSKISEYPHTPTLIPATPNRLSTPTPNVILDTEVLPTLYIDIAPDDFEQIKTKQREALEKWILIASDEDYVPAVIRLGNGAPLSVRLRLKGDWADHFSGDKWSYRIQFRDGASLLGMRVFSIQAPSTRSYLNEWLFLDHLRQQDILAVRYMFVHVVENGKDKGIYALEEAFSKELFESLGRREGIMIRYNEDLLWRHWAEFENDLSTPRGVSEFYIIDEFQTNKVLSDPLLQQQNMTAVGQLRGYWQGYLAASEVFDIEKTARFLALTDIWGAEHSLQWHNLRYYYNPITTKLEPVAFDTQALANSTRVELNQLKGIRQTIALNDPQIQRAYATALWEYTEPHYLDQLKTMYSSTFASHQNALSVELASEANINGKNVLQEPWTDLEYRQRALRELLSPLQMTYVHISADAKPSQLMLNIGNLLDFPVEIIGININGKYLPATRDWISTTSADHFVKETIADEALVLHPLDLDAQYIDYAVLSIPDINLKFDTQPDQKLSLVTRIWGLSNTVMQPVQFLYPKAYTDTVLPDLPELSEVISTHPYLYVDEDTEMLLMQQGQWDITQDLILPDGYGLQISAGTELRFGSGVILLSHGPLQFKGTEMEPIILAPLESEWSGIVVLNSDSDSHWSYTFIKGTNTIARNGWILTGGVTFYDSPVEINHCVFSDAIGEDALNIIHSQFAIKDSSFLSTRFDAFDGDFAQGHISGTRFKDISSDGIDISGSDISIENIQMESIGDKGISVGESSRLSGIDILIKNANFGVVSKDLSQVEISSIILQEIRIAGFAAYTKKPEYGPASMVIQKANLERVNPDNHTMVQTGSWLDLDNVRIWGSDIDIDTLYNP